MVLIGMALRFSIINFGSEQHSQLLIWKCLPLRSS